jgi:hypothetical protein
MRYSVWFVAAGLFCLLAGVGVGFWFMTPAGGDLLLLPTHVHFNLFGWTTLALYGLIHGAFPQLAGARLAPAQFWLALAGGVFLPIGFGLPRESAAHAPVVAAGALGGSAAVLMFAAMFIGKVVLARRS